MITILSIIVVIITAILVYLRRHFTYWQRQGVPGYNYVNLALVNQCAHITDVQCFEKFGRIYGLYTFTGTWIAVNEPELLNDIFVKDFHIFPDHLGFHLGTSKLDKSMFFIPGNNDWKRQRNIISPVFTSGKLRSMLHCIDNISDRLVDNLCKIIQNNDKQLDMRQHVGAFSMDVICQCAYGIDVDSIANPNHPIVSNAKKILSVDIKLPMIISALFPGLARLLKLEPFDMSACKYFNDLTNKIIDERKKQNKHQDNNAKRRTDFLQLMIDAEMAGQDSDNNLVSNKNQDNKLTQGSHKPLGKLSIDEMVAQGLLFFIAGYDTSSSALTHALYYLSQNPDCQQKLYQELKSCDEFTYEKLVHLKYLNAVINETLRLAPSFVKLFRVCRKDYKLGNTGITIPEGTSLAVNIYTLQRDPKYWTDPNEFKPERWFEPKHHPYAYLPFGAGPRVCVGQRFALNEMQMCLAKLISKFEFNLAPGFTELDYYKGSPGMSPKELQCQLKLR